MRTTLATLLLAGIAAAALAAPAQAAGPSPCKSAYCATLPNNAERMELLAYLADQKGDAIANSPVVCGTLSGSHRTGCAVLQGMIADAKRASAYTTLARGWSSESRDAFAQLLGAEEAFARCVGENEVDHMSADSGADAIAARQAEKDAFLLTLKKIASRPAHLSTIDFARVDAASADGALNAAYIQVMAVDDTSNLAWGSVEKSGIRQTQRAWLAYRDAFVTFAATLDADTIDAVKAELTTRRLVSLEGFLED